MCLTAVYIAYRLRYCHWTCFASTLANHVVGVHLAEAEATLSHITRLAKQEIVIDYAAGVHVVKAEVLQLDVAWTAARTPSIGLVPSRRAAPSTRSSTS